MMSNAEERACQYTGYCKNQSYSDFLQGYHQAEKDLELGWEDMETIQEIANNYTKYHTMEPRFFVYKEVLKRFKDYKERKEK